MAPNFLFSTSFSALTDKIKGKQNSPISNSGNQEEHRQGRNIGPTTEPSQFAAQISDRIKIGGKVRDVIACNLLSYCLVSPAERIVVPSPKFTKSPVGPSFAGQPMDNMCFWVPAPFPPIEGSVPVRFVHVLCCTPWCGVFVAVFGLTTTDDLEFQLNFLELISFFLNQAITRRFERNQCRGGYKLLKLQDKFLELISVGRGKARHFFFWFSNLVNFCRSFASVLAFFVLF